MYEDFLSFPPVIPKALSVQKSKELRSRILRKRDALAEHELLDRSIRVIECLKGLDAYQNSRLPMFYVSFRSEVYTHRLLRERLESGLTVILPETDVKARELRPRLVRDWKRDLRTGAYGILEPDPGKTSPVDPSSIDLVVVPGSVFDRRCGRYGYGGGYYDRFLSMRAPGASRVGLAFIFQVLDEIPLELHDEKMDVVVTDDGALMCRAGF